MNKNNTWKYLSLVIFAVEIITSILWIRGNYDASKIDIVEKDNELVSEINQNVSESQIKPTIELNPITEKINPPPYQGLNYRGTCGKSIEEFEAKVAKAKKERLKRKNIKYGEDFSEIQLRAIEGVKARCDKWYEFVDTYSAEEWEKYESEIEKSKELNGYFRGGNDISEKTKMSTARSMLASGEIDGSMFGGEALMYLLTHDYKLLLRIADELNIKGTEYIRSNILNISLLYNCVINYERDCAPNSMSSMTSCFSFANEDSCGISFNQYIAARTTPNNYMDLENIVSIIRQLVREGYFDTNIE